MSELTIPQAVSGIRRSLLAMDAAASVEFFSLANFDRLLKTTVSLCPECLGHVPAAVFTRGGRVLLRKRCPLHGASEARVESDENYYFLSNKDKSGRRFADDRIVEIREYAGDGCCGAKGAGCNAAQQAPFGPYTDQLANKSCTLLAEITNACNLACPVCYSDAKGDRLVPLEAFRRHVDTLIAQKGGLDSVQLTGGEAMLHPQFYDFVADIHSRPQIKKVYLPTNGLLLAGGDAATKLLPFRDKLMVLLQFDAGTVEANRAMRAANPEKARQRVIARLDKLGIPMQLTMTLTRGVNDAQIGWVVRQGLKHKNVKVIALQPVTYSGRYELAQEAEERLTLSDVLRAVAAQVRPRVRAEEFAPIPCSHPNCGWITLFVRRFGIVKNIMPFIDLPAIMNEVAYKTLLSTGELQKAVGPRTSFLRRLVRSTDIFTIAIKPFMDRFNYDQDRVANCCHHLMDTQGRAVSFCEYNALVRPRDSWEQFPTL